jgi:outer membrane lipoprotein LolB
MKLAVTRLPNVTLLFCIILLQASCTSTRLKSTPDAILDTAKSWTFRGKMALRGDQGKANLQIHWQQRSDEFDIHLMGPLGQAAAHLYGSGDALQIDIADQSRAAGTDELALVEESLGWEIPVKEMSFWVRGIAVPGLVHEIAYDDQGLPDWLEQSGWRVEYKKHKQQRPFRTIFSRESVQILLVVKEWQVNESR